MKKNNYKLLLELPLAVLLAVLPISVSLISVSVGVLYFCGIVFLILNRKNIAWNAFIKEPVILLVFIFLLWMWISCFIKGASSDEITRLGQMTSVIFILPMIYLCFRFINWKYIIMIFAFSLLVASIFASFKFFAGILSIPIIELSPVLPFPRNGGFHSSPPYLAGILIGGFYIAFALFAFPYKERLFRNTKLLKYISFIVLLFIILGIGVTQTRGLWIAIFVGGLVNYILIRQYIKNSVFILSFLLIYTILMWLLLFYLVPEYIDRIFSFLERIMLFNDLRINLYKLGLKIGLENPVFGVGTTGYLKAFSIDPEFAMNRFKHWHAHNDLIQIFVIGGFPLLISFIGLLLVIYYRLISFLKMNIQNIYNSYVGKVLLCSLISLLIYGMTDYIIFSPTTGYLYWLILGVTAKYTYHYK